MLGFDRDEYTADINQIEQDVSRIATLVGDVVELEAPRWERNRRANTKFWSSIREYATSLFASIDWRCMCASDHTAHLRLQSRKKGEYGNDPACRFCVLFTDSQTTDPQTTPWLWRQAQIEPSEVSDMP